MNLSRNRIATGLVIALIAVCILLPSTNVVMAADNDNLVMGSQGPAVKQVQQALNNKGYWCGSVDGIFGADTNKAVVRFQRDAGLPAYGIVGLMTKQALGINTTAVSRGGSSISTGRTMTMVATGYDNSYESNYPWHGAPSYIGLPLARGIVATDPRVIPMGTKLYIEGYGQGIAADQGNAIKGNRIDLFFNSRTEAISWGMKTVKVTIL